MRDITILIAHPDDEVIFGWPVLKEAKRIICCSSDLNNATRQWCKDRKKALQEIGAMTGAEIKCLDYDSEFYRVDARHGDLTQLAVNVLSLLQSAEFVYTHNPWGEYGHLDHILVHQIARASGKKLFYSDMCLDANWLPCTPWPLLQQPEKFCVNDISFYESCKRVYGKYGCWTWSKDPIINARLYADN
jgi:hypothetical protein